MNLISNEGFERPHHMFDNIVTDRPLTHDLLGKVSRKWRVIYADPAWSFKNWSELGEDRNPSQHYNTMSLEEIKAMPVGDIADDDSVCALWVIDPMLDQGIEVLKAWGFTFKTVLFYWGKTYPSADPAALHETKSFPIGTGYLSRAGSVETMIVGTKGSPKRRILEIDGVMKTDMAIRRLQFAPVGQHSEKPEKFAHLIERLWDGPYLELNSRKTRPGWGSWGDQVGLLDDGAVNTRRKKKAKRLAPWPLFEDQAVTI